VVAQVPPLRVALLDEGNFFLSLPTLQLFFASDRGRNLPIGFVIKQAVNLIVGCEPARDMLFVLSHAEGQVAGDADVQRAADAAEDANNSKMTDR
jgi:hypothetical protein